MVPRRFISGRSFAGRSQAQRRLTEWGASADVTTFLAIPPATKVLDQAFTEAILEDVTPGTIVRVRGVAFVRSDQTAATEDAFGAVGFAVVSEQARAAGAASLPGPITNEDSELWFLWQPLYVTLTLVSNVNN